MHDSFLRGNAWRCRLRGGGWSQNHYIERWLNSLVYKMDFQSWNLISSINIFDIFDANNQEFFFRLHTKILSCSKQKLSDVNGKIFCLFWNVFSCVATKIFGVRNIYHTAGLDTIFVQIYMDALPGVSKSQIFFFTNKTVDFLR